MRIEYYGDRSMNEEVLEVNHSKLFSVRLRELEARFNEIDKQSKRKDIGD